MAKKEITYKKALEELESIVRKIEEGEPDIDELGTLVKKAVGLVKYCKSKLKDTESEIKLNLEKLD